MSELQEQTHPTEPRWTHIALRVSDIDATIAWHAEFSPLELIDRREDEMGYGAWLGMPGETNNPFILVLAQFFEGKDPFAGAPLATLAPFAHFGIELPTKEDVDEMAERGKQAGCLAMPPHDDAATNWLHHHAPRPGRQYGRVFLGPRSVLHPARTVESGRLTHAAPTIPGWG